MTETVDVYTAADIVRGILDFVGNPDVSHLAGCLGISWLDDHPDVPKLVLNTDIDAVEIELARIELTRYHLNLEDHFEGGFSVVLEGEQYAHVLPQNRLNNVATWISSAREDLARLDCYEADRSITMAARQLADYLERGWPTDYPSYVGLQSEITEVKEAIAALAPVYVRIEGIDSPELRQRLAGLVNRFISDAGDRAFIYPSRGVGNTLVRLNIGPNSAYLERKDHDGSEMSGSGYSLRTIGSLPSDKGDLKVFTSLEFETDGGPVRFRSTISVFQTPDQLLDYFERLLAAGIS